MNKIFIVGLDILKKDDFLGPEATILKFKSITDLLSRHDDDPDLIIADKNQCLEISFRDLFLKFRDVPKIVLSDTPLSKGFAPWLKHPHIYPVIKPSEKELIFFVRKALYERKVLKENSRLHEELDGVKKE